MRRILVGVGALVCGLLVGQAAVAANPHYVNGPDFSVSGDALTVSGKIAGLGNNQFIEVRVVAQAERRCVNRGRKGHEPPGLIVETSGSGFFTSDKNGHVTFRVTTNAVTDDCPPGMRFTLRFFQATVSVYQGGTQVLGPDTFSMSG